MKNAKKHMRLKEFRVEEFNKSTGQTISKADWLKGDDDTSFCYPVFGRDIDTDYRGVVGFSRTFGGIQQVKKIYWDMLQEYKKGGIVYDGFDRWSSQQMANFLKQMVLEEIEGTLVLHGFSESGGPLYLDVPDDVTMSFE